MEGDVSRRVTVAAVLIREGSDPLPFFKEVTWHYHSASLTAVADGGDGGAAGDAKGGNCRGLRDAIDQGNQRELRITPNQSVARGAKAELVANAAEFQTALGLDYGARVFRLRSDDRRYRICGVHRRRQVPHHQEQDVEPVLDFAKFLANTGTTDGNIKSEGWLYAVIPPVIQAAMFKSGINFWTGTTPRRWWRDQCQLPVSEDDSRHHAIR